MTADAQARGPIRLMRVGEASELLGMKRPNVGKFLERRKIYPYARDASGALYLAEEVEAAKREYDADKKKREADARRRASAR